MAKKESTTKYEVTLESTPASGAKRTMWRGGRQFEVKVTQVLELTKEEVEVFKNDKRFKLSKATKTNSGSEPVETTSGSESDTSGGDETSPANDETEASDSEDSSTDGSEEDSDESTEDSEESNEDELKRLLQKKRSTLDKQAKSLGIENAEELKDKLEVAQAIVDAKARNSESGEATS